MASITRRHFVQVSAATAAATTLTSFRRPGRRSPNEEIRVAVVGVRGRGGNHIDGFQNQDNVRVAVLVDPDAKVLANRAAGFETKFGKKVETEVGLTILGARAKWERAEWDLVNSQRIKFVVGGFSLTSKLGSRVRVLIRPASLRDRLRYPSAVHLTHSFSVKWKAVGEHVAVDEFEQRVDGGRVHPGGERHAAQVGARRGRQQVLQQPWAPHGEDQRVRAECGAAAQVNAHVRAVALPQQGRDAGREVRRERRWRERDVLVGHRADKS